MSITIKKYWHYIVVAILGVLFMTEHAMVAMGAPPVFLTRLGAVQTTWPRSNKFSVGTTTPDAKLSVYANRGETLTKLFQVASSTATTQSNLLLVNNVGCIQVTATSTQSPVKLMLSTLGATSTFGGTVFFSAGTCP